MLLLWTFVGNFVVKAFGNGIRFQMRACGYLALCVQHVFVVDVCGQFAFALWGV
jgi:hypothetical protein